MGTNRLRWSGALVLGLLCVAPFGLGARAQVADVPALSNGEFGALVATLSEPDGVFAVSGLSFSDNVVSNEYLLQYLAPQLATADLAGRVYVGVGPEQNFTYIAATDPAVAFILDIRRENRDLHLFYKAVFELSADRAAFLSRLFSRDLPAEALNDGLDAALNRLGRMPPSRERLSAGAREISEQLTVVRGLELSRAEAQNIGRLHEAFATLGPGVHYGSDGRSDRSPVWLPTLSEMLTAVDRDGNPWSFLADEERYRRVRNLHLRNLIVPVVGDFAGDRALRAIAAWVRDRQLLVGTFFASNVEVFLQVPNQRFRFCRNLSTFGHDARSRFICTAPLEPRARPQGVRKITVAEPGSVLVGYPDGRSERLSRRQGLAEAEAMAEIFSLQTAVGACVAGAETGGR